MRLGIGEILLKASQLKVAKERVEFLQKHQSPQLIKLLNCVFDPAIKFSLPEGKPPYKPNKLDMDTEGLLYYEAQRIDKFFVGHPLDVPRNTYKRQTLFISLLESCDPRDAEFLCAMKDKKMPDWCIVTKRQFEEAFPNQIKIDWSVKENPAKAARAKGAKY